jgi:hypothetical protein
MSLLVGLAALALPACGKPASQEPPRDGGPKAAPSEEARKAERERERAMADRLRQLATGVSDYAVARRHLLPAALCDKKTGRLLLSWRVALLPHVGQEALFKQFRLDEPWDSPHNKKLLEKMPPLYARPGGEPGPGTVTYFRGFVAAPGSPVRTAWATLPDDKAPLGFSGGRFPNVFKDGTSHTFAVVEAAEPVPWTRPGELVYDPKGPLPKLGGLSREGFYAGMMDGSALLFSNQIDEAIVRKFITADGREPVDEALWRKGLIRIAGPRRDAD